MACFEIELILKDSTTVLKEGFSPGGFLKQSVRFEVSEEEAASPLFKTNLSQYARRFMEDNVRIKLTPLSDADYQALKDENE